MGLRSTLLVTLLRSLSFALVLAVAGAVGAQPLPAEASDLLARAQAVASRALLRYDVHFPDQPEWREALALGGEAARLAPDHPAPQRFLAQAYGTVQWNSRAWNAWQAYLELGGTVDAQVVIQLVSIARSLGILTFDGDRRAEALPYLETVLRYAPDDLAANTRLALWHADRGEYEQALRYVAVVDEVAGDELEEFVLDIRTRAGYVEERPGAQPLPAEASDVLARAQAVASRALLRYDVHFPDQAEWREALALGRNAARLAPEHPAPQRFLAQAYGTVQWNSRAWNAWQAYLELGGTVDAQVVIQLVSIARSLAVLTFDADRRAEALPYLETVLRYAPDDLAANTRLALWHADRGEYEQALPYVAVVDESAGEAFEEFVLDVRRRALYADLAVDAYDEGRAAQDAGQFQRALASYRAAVDAAPAFTEAWRAFGALALALERYDDAVTAFERVIAAAPNDAAARDALQRAGAGAQAAAAAAAPPAPPQVATVPEPTPQPTPTPAPPQVATVPEPTPQPEPAPQPTPTPPPAEPAQAQTPAPAPAPTPEPAPAPEPAPEPAAAAPAASAGQLVAVDRWIEHRSARSGGAGAFTFVDAPALAGDLTGYVGGSLHVRVEVLGGPSDAPVLYQVCLVPFDISIAPACSDANGLVVGASGVFVSAQSLAALSGSGLIDWGDGIGSVMLIMRDETGTPLDDQALTAAGERRQIELDRYYPRTVHIQAVLVPPGTSFSRW